MIEFLKEFQGILGAVLGVVVTLTTSEFLRRIGRRRMYIRSNRIEFLKRENNFGEIRDTPTDKFEEVSLFSYEISVAIYNSSDIYFSLFDLQLEFQMENGNVFFHYPYDSDKTKFSTSWVHELFSSIDIEPKKLKIINMIGWIHKEQLGELTQSGVLKKAFLVAKNHKNKQFRKKIAI